MSAAWPPSATVSLLAAAILRTAMPSETPDRLKPCPRTPNCVSTQATRDDQRMDPIPYRGDLETARSLLLEILDEEPRVDIDDLRERVIQTVFTTRIMRFRDDVVFLLDPDQRMIHFRSASRIGRSDWGANRRRMERLSERFMEAQRSQESTP